MTSVSGRAKSSVMLAQGLPKRVLNLIPGILSASILLLGYPKNVRAQGTIWQKLFEPKIISVTNELRSFIRNDLPPVSHNRNVELKHIDMIFEQGMKYSKGDAAVALLGISIAVLNRTYITPSLPIIGRVWIPLPAEDSALAAERIRKLPRYFFNDSPDDKWGDSAKLVHFFGSAYLTYETGTRALPDQIGKWIEEGEETFKLDSLGQKRDIYIDRLGQQFGWALSQGRNVLPSDFLRAEISKNIIDKIQFH
ncbi:MAG: hypothetical protein M1339_01335 [Bacteroidetes bacterium]|nr:hypothetical protein [Bacteroidota bacterium]